MSIIVAVVQLTTWSVRIGRRDDIVISLLTNVVSVPIAGIIAFIYFTAGRDRIIIRRYRKRAARHPGRLLVGATQDAVILSRSDLVAEVLDELLHSGPGRAHVITGPAGSGKTTLMQDLIRALASVGHVPVAVRLDRTRGLPSLEEELSKQFVGAIDDFIRSSGEGERVWRTANRSGRVICVIDGVDDWRALMGMSPGDALDAIAALIVGGGFRVVVAVRSEEADFAERYPTFPLPPLPIGERELDRMLSTYPLPVDGALMSTWRAALAAADGERFPLFMTLSMALLQEGRLLARVAVSRSAVAAQVLILSGWLQHQARRFAARSIRARDELEGRMTLLSHIAFRMCEEGRLELHFSEVNDLLSAASGSSSPLSWREIVGVYQMGLGLQILQAPGSGDDPAARRFQFTHSILQAFMAAEYLRRSGHDLDPHRLMRSSEELSAAARMRLESDPNDQFSRRLSDYILSVAQSDAVVDHRLLTLLPSTASLTPEAELVLVAALRRRFTQSDDRSRLAMIALLERGVLGNHQRYELLWDWVAEGDYAVAQTAARQIGYGGTTSLLILMDRVEALLLANRGRFLYNASDWRDNGGRLTAMATVIPAWRQSVDTPDRPVVDGWIDIIIELLEVGQLGGIEVSILAGFSSIFRDHLVQSEWGQLERMTRAVKSHNGRVRLVQIYSRLLNDYEYGSRARTVLHGWQQNDQHPFVRAAASLALGNRAEWESIADWRWNGQREPKAGMRLARKAHLLFSDAYLLSRLEDQGSGEAEEVERRQASWLSTELPWCLAKSRTRKEIFNGCHPDCTAGLCPLHLAGLVPESASPISDAFLGRATDLTATHMRPWAPRFLGEGPARFWRRLGAAMELKRGGQ